MTLDDVAHVTAEFTPLLVVIQRGTHLTEWSPLLMDDTNTHSKLHKTTATGARRQGGIHEPEEESQPSLNAASSERRGP